jgi:hypothetical protein
VAVFFEGGNKDKLPANFAPLDYLGDYYLSRGNIFFKSIMKISFHRRKIKISDFIFFI